MTGESLLALVLDPRKLTARFQPVEGAGLPVRTHYLEGLVSGPRGTNLERSDVLLSFVRRKGAEAEFDRASVRAVLGAARRLPCELGIGVNVHAETLASDPEFLSFLGDTAMENWISPARLVVEILECVTPPTSRPLIEALAGLRAIGVGIALDDVGSGHSNYKMMLDCRPAYFKVGAYLVHGVATDYYRQAVLGSIVELARRFGARVVAEGVASLADLGAVRNAGVPLVQGPLFGPPLPAEELEHGAGDHAADLAVVA